MVELIQSGLLPVTALAAIALFFLREFLEWRRRASTSALRLEALKKLLATECQQNQWALNWIKQAAGDIPAALGTANTVKIENSASGQDLLVFEAPDNSFESKPLPLVYDAFLRSHLFEAAALNRDMFEKMTSSVGAVEEIRHLLRGLFEHVQDDQMHLKSWCEYANRQVDDIAKELGELYYICKGIRKIPAKIRPGT
jgi:hypothetical protein